MTEDWGKNDDSYLSSLKGRLFGNLNQQNPGKGFIPFSRALYLPDNTTLIDLNKFDKIMDRHKKIGDELKLWATGRTLDLRERNLRGANLDRTDLRNVDLFGARLQGASLSNARLEDASLQFAQLQGALLSNARLQGASLYSTKLQGASLHRARLGGASLNFANLQGASLSNARLEGALLYCAELQGASLDYAELQGASLDYANLQGASLNSTNLQGASLDSANLQDVSLEKAHLQGASLENANFHGASLVNTFLWRAHGGALWRTYRASPPSVGPSFTFINEPQLVAMTIEEIAKLMFGATSGIKDENTKKHINKRLARLSVSDADLKDGLPATYWANITKKMNAEDYQKDLAERLKTLACDPAGAPYVAEGLIRHRSSNLNSNIRPAAKALPNAADDAFTDCPGKEGVVANALAKLCKLPADMEN